MGDHMFTEQGRKPILALSLIMALALVVSACQGPGVREEGIDEGNITGDGGAIGSDGTRDGITVVEDNMTSDGSNITGGDTPIGDDDAGEAVVSDFMLISQSFMDGEEIPSQYTCDSDGMSPEVSWSGLPEGTESVALIMEDPDAPGGLFTHWVVYNIPAEEGGLDEGAGSEDMLPEGAMHGTNEVGLDEYMGPCPPTGTHRYILRAYALDTEIDDPGPVDRQVLLDEMEGHVLGESAIMGTYTR